jgi:WD40 repeat protein
MRSYVVGLFFLVSYIIFIPGCLDKGDQDFEKSISTDFVEEVVEEAEKEETVPVKKEIHSFVKLPDPIDSPLSDVIDVAFSHDSLYLALAHRGVVNITVYKRNGDDFVKLPEFSEYPTGAVNAITFSHDSSYLAIAQSPSTKLGSDKRSVTIYKRKGDSFIKMPTPLEFPSGNAHDVAFSHDSSYLAVAHWLSPYVTVYKREGGSFSMLPKPIVLPPTSCTGIAFSKDSNYLALSTLSAPYIVIYARNGDSFTMLPGSLEPAAVRANSVAFSHDSSYLAVVSEQGPRITIYKNNGDSFSKLPVPVGLPGFIAEDVDFNHDSTLMAVANWGGAAPNIIIYRREGDLFAKLPDPVVELPAGVGMGVSFSHDSRYLAVAHTAEPYITIYKNNGIAVDVIDVENDNKLDKKPILSPRNITEENIDNAIKWAMDFVNVIYLKDEGYYENCLQFAQHAYTNGAGLKIQTNYGSASNAAYLLEAEKNKDNEPPPVGSWIFYTVEHDPRGHAAISLEEGQMIHVNTDVDKGTAEVQKIGYKDLEKIGIIYIGWAWPVAIQ